MFTNTNLLLDDFRDKTMTFQASGNSIYLTLDWQIVRNLDEFKNFILESGLPKLISFDHDLEDGDYDCDGNYSERTGKECADWLVNHCLSLEHDLPDFIIHSQNPDGRKRIQSVFDTYYKAKEKGII